MKLPYSYSSKKNGFTLIELLIVIMIIAVLAGLIMSVINSGGIRGKSRDSQRIADLKKIQTALELYFVDNRSYPISGWEIVDGASGTLVTSVSPDYISDVPADPEHTSGNTTPCAGPDSYRYNYWSDGLDYVLTANMEVETSIGDQSCESLNNWDGGWCGSVATNCYGVENP